MGDAGQNESGKARNVVIPLDAQLKSLDAMWDGPLFEIRGGMFDPEVYDAIIETINKTEIDDTANSLPIFRKLWYIPIFVMHNYDRWKQNGKEIDEERFQNFLTGIENALIDKLGL